MGWSTNEKAEAKRARQAQKKQQKQKNREEAVENKKWRDQVTDSKVKKQRQKEQRRQQQLIKRQQMKQLIKRQEQEMEKISKKKQKIQTPKITQSELAQRLAQIQQQSKPEFDDPRMVKPKYDMQNNNQLMGQMKIARNVQQALNIMEEKVEKHPQKRYKAAFQEYCEKRQKQIKLQNPQYKRSQRLQIMRKQFQKHPDNPFNKNVVAYNEKKKQQSDEEQN